MQNGTTKRIPLIKPFVGEEELVQLKSVLRSGWLSQGPKVKQFEREIAEFLRAKYVLATTSCTSALSVALDALDIRQGSEVIVPDFTFPATGNVVFEQGARPVIVDVDLDSYATDPREVKRAISKKTSAIMVVHPFGHPVDLDEIYEIAEREDIEVIEDAATAFGSRYKGRRIGQSGRAVCFSFHPRKLLTTGEGGCVVTEDERIAKNVELLRNHGEVSGQDGKRFVRSGLNLRMSDLQAAVGIAQLAKLEGIISRRRKQAETYSTFLSESGLDVHPPSEAEWAYSTFQSYVIRLGPGFPLSQERCIEVMRKNHGIEVQIGTYSLHAQPAFRSARKVGKLRDGHELYKRTVTLPLYHTMTEQDQTYVVECLKAIAS